jgi:RNA polymerase sigma-70 factor, ECF subfamily
MSGAVGIVLGCCRVPGVRTSNPTKKRPRFVQQATDNLPEIFRIVFVARVIEGMSVEETVDLLGQRMKMVKTRLHRARRLLRGQLESQIGPILMDAFAGRRCERMTNAIIQRLGLSG